MQDEGRLGRWLGASSAACNMQVGAVCRSPRATAGTAPFRDAYRPQGLYGLTNRAALVPKLNLGSFQPRGNRLDPLRQAFNGARGLLLELVEPLQPLARGGIASTRPGVGELVEDGQCRQ
jgi:hypothetical protein